MAEFLRVIDIETTGFAPPEAEVIEVGWQDVVWSGKSWRVSPEHAGSALFGCTKPCPPQAQAVHHIADRDLRLPNGQMRPPFSPDALHQMFGEERLVYVAHNAEFERSFLADLSDRWLCTYKAANRVWPEAPGKSNQVLRYWLGLDLDDAQAMPPHRARPDAYVTAHILCALLNVASLEDMISWTSEPRAMAACPIGKHKGKPWAEIDRGYLTWMVGSDMKDDLKWNAQRELDRRATEAA